MTENEGTATKAIEKKTSKIPSSAFLLISIGAMAASASLKCMHQEKAALFIGQWVAPFLLFGIYNKIVKTEGHD